MLTGFVLLLIVISVMGLITRAQDKAREREAEEARLRKRLREAERRKALREQGEDPDKGRPRSRRIRKKRDR